jgi:protein SCO1/2
MHRPIRHLRRLALIAILAITGAAQAQPSTPPPDRYEPVPPKFKRDTAAAGITEHLGAQIPLNLKFIDSTGQNVELSQYFNKGRPVILQMGYFNCPMLCDLVSKGVMKSVKGLDLELGKDYDILYVSINPLETWQLAQEKKRNYVEEYSVSGRTGASLGWNFLVGQDAHTKPLADAVGFGFQKVEGKAEYSHPAMVVVLTPEGKISRYLYGNEFSNKLVRLSLVEASSGKIGTLTDQLMMLCYHYDGVSGQYTPRWMFLMRSAGVVTVLVLGFFLGRRWIHDARAERHAAASAV